MRSISFESEAFGGSYTDHSTWCDFGSTRKSVPLLEANVLRTVGNLVSVSMGKIVPAAMIFVPSIGGQSHVREERTADRDLLLGVEALAASIVEVDKICDSLSAVRR